MCASQICREDPTVRFRSLFARSGRAFLIPPCSQFDETKPFDRVRNPKKTQLNDHERNPLCRSLLGILDPAC